MRLPSLALTLLSSSILIPSLLCAPASPVSPNPSLSMPPIHVPICHRDPGGFNLFICARLLTALQNLPYYHHRKVWSEYASGDGHLPAAFFYEDAQKRSCHLSMDLYEPGIPITAKETFSLEEQQTDFNNLYFECLRKHGVGGFNRIGFLGNVAALLGPKLEPSGPWISLFKGMVANGTEATNIRTIDLTPFGDS